MKGVRLMLAPEDFPFDVDDPGFRFPLRTFHAVNKIYNSFRATG